MNAEHVIVETDESGKIRTLPELPPNHRYEMILLDLEAERDHTSGSSRRPHPKVAGRIEFLGDIIATASEADWNLPR